VAVARDEGTDGVIARQHNIRYVKLCCVSKN
jgi:hypothetical protein